MPKNLINLGLVIHYVYKRQEQLYSVSRKIIALAIYSESCKYTWKTFTNSTLQRKYILKFSAELSLVHGELFFSILF